MKKYADKCRRQLEFQVEDLVMLKFDSPDIEKDHDQVMTLGLVPEVCGPLKLEQSAFTCMEYAVKDYCFCVYLSKKQSDFHL